MVVNGAYLVDSKNYSYPRTPEQRAAGNSNCAATKQVNEIQNTPVLYLRSQQVYKP